MRIKMTNRAFAGAANVLPEEVATWEAAGWVAEQNPRKKPTTAKEPNE